MIDLQGNEKAKLGMVAIGAIALIVCVGLATGHNSVIAGTGLAVIGAIMGAIFGFYWGISKA